jgi:ABC-type phosphate transport system substrate-binding protein
VNAYVKQTFGAIGYVEFAYARRGGVAYTVLQNAAGRFIRPEAAALLPPPAPRHGAARRAIICCW